MVFKGNNGERPQKSPFTVAVKNVRGFKKGKVQVHEPEGKKLRSEGELQPEKSQDQSQHKKKENTKGSIVFLSHLPRGFEEKGIRRYVGQFGKVAGVRLVRSKKTGRSRGFAFVEFVERDVAEIVVSSMKKLNQMLQHIVKAELAAPKDGEKETPRVFNSVPIKPEHTRAARNRQAYLKRLDEKSEHQFEKHTRRNLRRLQKKLEARGISFHVPKGWET